MTHPNPFLPTEVGCSWIMHDVTDVYCSSLPNRLCFLLHALLGFTRAAQSADRKLLQLSWERCLWSANSGKEM